ncbi:MAG TPA: DciA family protein [Actinomycetes bacterium]|nr:DciA family protein [Actinomycetes bacterium]
MSDESSVPDEPEQSAPGEPAETDRPRRPGLEVARELLASARAEARRRGFRPGGTPAARTGRGDEPGARRRRPVDDTRSGAHPDERDPQVLGSALGRLVADRGWETDAAVGGVMGRWAAIVGDQVAEHARPLAFDDGELVVAADTTAWATQIRLLAPTLLARLADELGAGVVTSVVVRGPGGPSWKRGRLAVRGRGPRDTYG